MASTSTVTLEQTINYAAIYLRQMPLVSVGGFANEPALTIANQVLSLLLAPPLAWPWNRKTNSSQSTTVGTQDYPISISDFGWLEQASLADASGNVSALEVSVLASAEKTQGKPRQIAAQLDDGAENITFRLFPVPDAAYTLSLVYQKAPTLITATTGTWAPVPDKLIHLYTTGFLAKAYEMVDDSRFPMTLQMFMNGIVGANNGLSETQKNLFLWSKMRDLREAANEIAAPRESRNLVRE